MKAWPLTAEGERLFRWRQLFLSTDRSVRPTRAFSAVPKAVPKEAVLIFSATEYTSANGGALCVASFLTITLRDSDDACARRTAAGISGFWADGCYGDGGYGAYRPAVAREDGALQLGGVLSDRPGARRRSGDWTFRGELYAEPAHSAEYGSLRRCGEHRADGCSG